MAEPNSLAAVSAAPPALRVALVNAMGDAALAITEQRFTRLLRAAFPDRPVELRCATLPAIPRGEMAAARIARHYLDLEALRASPPDAVIFSGAEPATADLRHEIFWPDLASLFDWVAASRLPAVFSCLAAHAAVLHFTGVARRPLDRKCFGIFAQLVSPEAALAPGLPQHIAVAHSRWNDLPAPCLQDAGFRILSQSAALVDCFVASDAPMLFFQGHPEYELAALHAEYRRDRRRFESGTMRHPPAPPDLADAQPANLAAGLAFACQRLRNVIVAQQAALA